MRVPLLGLLALLGLQCAPAQRPSSPPAREEVAVADPAPPEVAVIGGPAGGFLSVTFRAAEPVLLSSTDGIRLVTPRGTVEAALSGLPTQSHEEATVVVTGSYVLAGPDVGIANASDRSSTLEVTVGGAVHRFPVIRGDVIE